MTPLRSAEPASANPLPRPGRFFDGPGVPLTVALAALVLSILSCWPAEEDAFIYFRFALHAARGLGLVFNPGERVEGFSSPLWMLLLAAAARVGHPAVHVWARGLGVVCGAATVLATDSLARRLAMPSWARLGAMLTVAGNFYFLVWAQSGLETPLYSLLLAAAAAAYLRRSAASQSPATGRRFGAIGTGALLGFAALGRPEGVLLLLCALLDHGLRPRPWRDAAAWALPAVVVLGLEEVWRRVYFAAWLPNTSVKLYTLHFDRSVPQALGFLGYMGGLVWFTLPLAFSRRVEIERRGQLRFLWLAGLVTSLAFHFLAGGDYRFGYRYLVAALPLLAVAAWGSFEASSSRLRQPSRAALGVLLAATLLAPSAILFWRDPHRQRGPAAIARAWSWPFPECADWAMAPGCWLADHAPAGSSVAFGQMGKTPYYLALIGKDVRFLDTVGWVDRDVAQLYRPDRKLLDVIRRMLGGERLADAVAAGRAARVSGFVELVLRRRPDYVLAEPQLEHPGVAALVADPRFLRVYESSGALGPPPAIQLYARRR